MISRRRTTILYETGKAANITSKKLVAYFSASSVIAKVAQTLAEAIGADIFGIAPKIPYAKTDINWMDKNAHSTIKVNGPTFRLEIESKWDNMLNKPLSSDIRRIFHNIKN